ncbi:MAG: non-homologous end joining protein Ku [Acidimicrobiales bacterium]
MPRAIWSGSISFGLVNIPVKLYGAVSRKTVHFNQIDSRTQARIKQKRVSSEDGSEVPYENIVKGYELSSGAYVIISDDELAALDPKALRTIDIDEFVDLAEIDPIYYDSAYYLAPDKAAKPYALLASAMEEQGKVGIAHFVMRTKQYLAAIRPVDGKLMLSTMVYADEVNDPSSIPELADLDEVELPEKELTMARQLIESLSAEFEPDKFQDTYRKAVEGLIEAKAAGEEVIAPVNGVEPAQVIDLMAALEASVAAAKDARSRHPTAHDAAEDEAEDEESAEVPEAKAPPKKAAAKKRTAKKAPAKKVAAKKATAARKSA